MSTTVWRVQIRRLSQRTAGDYDVAERVEREQPTLHAETQPLFDWRRDKRPGGLLMAAGEAKGQEVRRWLARHSTASVQRAVLSVEGGRVGTRAVVSVTSEGGMEDVASRGDERSFSHLLLSSSTLCTYSNQPCRQQAVQCPLPWHLWGAYPDSSVHSRRRTSLMKCDDRT